MGKRASYLLLAALLLVAAVSCDRDRGKVIPRGKFARIYAEMALADEWLASNSTIYRELVDTTNFYEPIFNRYGYTAKDYIASVEHYIDDPLRYGRILRKAQALIVERQAVLQQEYDAAQGNAAEQHRRTED